MYLRNAYISPTIIEEAQDKSSGVDVHTVDRQKYTKCQSQTDFSWAKWEESSLFEIL